MLLFIYLFFGGCWEAFLSFVSSRKLWYKMPYARIYACIHLSVCSFIMFLHEPKFMSYLFLKLSSPKFWHHFEKQITVLGLWNVKTSYGQSWPENLFPNVEFDL